MRQRISGITIVEVTVALGIFVATGLPFLVAMSRAAVFSKSVLQRQQAQDLAAQTAEEILLFDQDSHALFNKFHDPPRVTITDSDDDQVFNTGLAKIIIREDYQPLTDTGPAYVEVILFKSER